MRRGFKKDAKEIAAEIRGELGLAELDPLDPWRLGEHLDIPIWPLNSYDGLATACVDTLTGREHGAFSAMIAVAGRRHVIVHNDSHALPRQRANICHELAHALLIHRPHPATPGEPLTFDLSQEEEAGFLGGVLLVTDEACLAACRAEQSAEAAARRMGVSVPLMRWRLNSSGAKRRVARARKKRRV